MKTKRSKIIIASAVTLLLITSVVQRSVYGIKNFSLVKDAQAQMGQGLMQNIMPIMMLMMLMNMMQQNKGNQLQREQSNAVKNANSNLMQAGTQPSNGVKQPGLPNPLTNPSTNPVNNQPTNPLTNLNNNPLGIFMPR
jgi:uncharacterized membrane protein